MRSRQPGMSPEKIAMAVAVTIAATAGTGGMKKVIGTSSAVAMVAVRPGMQPKTRPIAWESTAQVTLPFPCSPRDGQQHAPGQRHAQPLVEDQVDQQGRNE